MIDRKPIGQLIDDAIQRGLTPFLEDHSSLSELGYEKGKLLDRQQLLHIEAALRQSLKKEETKLVGDLAETQRLCEQEVITLEAFLEDIRGKLTTAQNGRESVNELLRGLSPVLREQFQVFYKRYGDIIACYDKKKNEINERLEKEKAAIDTGFSVASRDSLLKISDYALRWGKPGKDSGNQNTGYIPLIQDSIDQLRKNKIEQCKKDADQELGDLKELQQKMLESLMRNVGVLPVRREVWFNTLVSLLLFLVEIPIHLVFTTKALKLSDEWKYTFAVGLPLGIGLIFKVAFFEAQKYNLKIVSRIGLALAVILVFSIALLNGVPLPKGTTLGQLQSGGSPTLDWLRFSVFISATLVLSFIGAYYFEKARDGWSRLKIISYKPKVKYNKKEVAGMEKSRVEKEVQLLDINHYIEELRRVLSEDILSIRFEEALLTALAQIKAGFEAGWRAEVLRRIQAREPLIPWIN